MANADGANLAEKLSNFGYDELINLVEIQLQANNVLDSGSYDGLVRSIDNGRDGDRPDGVGRFKRGLDRPGSTNVGKTATQEAHMANKEQIGQDPADFHILVDWDSRYIGNTGTTSMASLARLTVAMACVAMERRSAADFEISIVGREPEPKILNNDETGFDSIDKMAAYDEYVSKAVDLKDDGEPSTLTDGLERILDSGLVDHYNSVCLVISDFIMGKVVDKDDKINGFDWQDNLAILGDLYGDRLYVARLTSPDHIYLPFDHTYFDGEKVITLSESDYTQVAYEYYTKGTAKAEIIANLLSQFRTVELSSTDPTPMATVANFMFGKPEDD